MIGISLIFDYQSTINIFSFAFIGQPHMSQTLIKVIFIEKMPTLLSYVLGGGGGAAGGSKQPI